MAERDAIVAGARDHLMRVAFRMLGTVAEAEDAVQEAYARWVALGGAGQQRIEHPVAWLTTVTTRVCLDLLGSAAHRREQYIGPWLPEFLPAGTVLVGGAGSSAGSSPGSSTGSSAGSSIETGGDSRSDDPEAQAILRDSVSTAVLRLMEQMTPAERVAVVLHDVFAYSFREIGEMLERSPGAARELASSGRKHLATQQRHEIDVALHRETVAAFREASESGDVTELVRLLDPRVVLTSDGGGVVRAALNPIRGADKVARFLIGVGERRPDVRLALGETADGAALLFVDGNGVSAVVNFEIGAAGVSQVWIQWNPHKLGKWATRA